MPQALPIKPRPWWRQFWPWFLIAVPLLTLAAGAWMLVLARRTPDAAITDSVQRSGLVVTRRDLPAPPPAQQP